MKVLYVYGHITAYGGVERIFVDKMNYLVNYYHEEVFLLTWDQGNHRIPFPLDDRVTHTDLGVLTYRAYQYHGIRRLWEKHKRMTLFKRSIRDYVANLAPDIIITTTVGPIKHLLKIKGDARLIIESHSGYNHIMEFSYDSFRNRYKYQLQKYRIKKADCVVSLTEGDAALWRTFHHYVVTIPNIIHYNTMGYVSTLENKQVIYVGRYEYQKAIPDLIEIWRLVNRSHPDWKLEMYGKGLYDEFLRDIVEHDDINININPPSNDIHSRLVESSIFIIASYYEPFGLVIGEAMSCGLPVVAFNCPFGPAELINNNANGFLVENRDIRTFADKICQLIENHDLRKQMGKAAAQSAQGYSAEIIMSQWKQLFELLAYIQ